MDYIVTIEPSLGSTRIMIPLDIPDTLLSSGVVEGYATKLCGWTPKINQTTVDGDGIETTTEINNPISAIDACAMRIRGFAFEDMLGVEAAEGAQEGREKRVAEFKSAFGIKA